MIKKTKFSFLLFRKEFAIMSLIVTVLGLVMCVHDVTLGIFTFLYGLGLTCFYFWFGTAGFYSLLAIPCFLMGFYQVLAAILLKKVVLLTFVFLFEAASMIMSGLLFAGILKGPDSVAGTIAQVLMVLMVLLGLWWFGDGTWVLVATTKVKALQYLTYYIPYAAVLVLSNLMNFVYARVFYKPEKAKSLIALMKETF